MLKKESVPSVVTRSAAFVSNASAESVGIRVRLYPNLTLEGIDRFSLSLVKLVF